MLFLLGKNKKLHNSHFLFLTYLLVLLIAPKKTLSEGGSSINFAIIVLFFWLAYNLFKYKDLKLNKSLPIILFLLFTTLSLITSFITFKSVVIFNAIQFFLYATITSILFNKYLSNVVKENEFQTVIKIINFVGIIYSLGSIISLYTGPIYPFQVGDNQRFWGGIILQQGVGFGVNQNSVGGILVLLLIICTFFINSRYKKYYISIYILAILSTISRSAYLCLFSGWAVFKLIQLISNRKLFNFRVGVKNLRNTFLLLIFISISAIWFFEVHKEYYEALKIGFNLTNGNINEQEGGRIDQWTNGISSWRNSSTLEFLIGKGFKNSSKIIDNKYISAHNLYIQYLSDMGLIGIIIFLCSISVFLVNLLRKIKGNTRNNIYYYCLFSITSLLVHNFTEVFLYGVEYITFFILILHIYHYPKLVNSNIE